MPLRPSTDASASHSILFTSLYATARDQPIARCGRRQAVEAEIQALSRCPAGHVKHAREAIGYFHIDIAELRTGEGKLHMFVAIDRTSKFAIVQLEKRATSMAARAFLEALIETVSYRIHTILTPSHRLHANDCRAAHRQVQVTWPSAAFSLSPRSNRRPLSPQAPFTFSQILSPCPR